MRNDNQRIRWVGLRSTGILVACALLCGCAMGRDGLTVASVPLRDEPAGAMRAGELLWRGTLHLRHSDSDFGGLSSIRVSPDGKQFVAISDRGRRVAGRLRYGADGLLTGAADIAIAPLLGADGDPLPTFFNDTEGLALLGDWPGDGWAVSMERRHSILRYPPALAGSPAVPVEGPAGLADLPFNSGIETLVSLPGHRLLAMAEDEGAEGRHRAWVGRSGDWREFAYQGTPPYLPVDTTRLPDGGLLVLERRVGLLGGWGSRIVHVDAAALDAAIQSGGVLSGREIGRIDPPMATENYEGIDCRQLPDGRIAVYIVSDDNFSAILQRTLLTQFIWQR